MAFDVNATIENKTPSDVVISLTIGGEIGIKEKKCKGIGLSCLEWDFDVDITKFGPSKPGTAIIQFEVLSNKQLRLTFFSSNTGDLEVLVNTSLKSKVSKALGYSDITVLPGVYKTQKRADGAYVVTVNMQTR